ncbi:hypothetical protein IV203_013035 [Nitzschia inconspicua]|uniref:Uncharacterized protein n=1 Tax=Nitzschia inconspicua TaxID=303405 RepID=A0A9K3M569_9STRA|nr:hypothetical protein IV203_013035 [Nitzschia inconspicua]
MRIVAFNAVWYCLAVSFNVVSGQRRRRASIEQHRMDLEDVAFWRTLILEGSVSVPPVLATMSPTSAPELSSSPSTGFPTKTPTDFPSLPPTKGPHISPPTAEPTVSYEPSLSLFPTKSPTFSPTVSDEPTVSYEPSNSEDPHFISNDEP